MNNNSRILNLRIGSGFSFIRTKVSNIANYKHRLKLKSYYTVLFIHSPVLALVSLHQAVGS